MLIVIFPEWRLFFFPCTYLYLKIHFTENFIDVISDTIGV